MTLWQKVRSRRLCLVDILTLLLRPAAALAPRKERLPFVGADWQAALAQQLALYTIVSLCVRLRVCFGAGLYRRYCHSASLGELVQILIATSLSTVVSIALVSAAQADASSLVIDARTTRYKWAVQALTMLRNAQANVLGGVLTHARLRPSDPPPHSDFGHPSARPLADGLSSAGLWSAQHSLPTSRLLEAALTDQRPRDPGTHNVRTYPEPDSVASAATAHGEHVALPETTPASSLTHAMSLPPSPAGSAAMAHPSLLHPFLALRLG